MKKLYRGIVEGNIIRFKEEIDLPVGTQTFVTLKPLNRERQDEIKERQLKLLNKGFYLGKKFYSRREDQYNR